MFHPSSSEVVSEGVICPYQPNKDDPFRFVDPEHIIQGCYPIPALEPGRTLELLPSSIARDKASDWKAFGVNW